MDKVDRIYEDQKANMEKYGHLCKNEREAVLRAMEDDKLAMSNVLMERRRQVHRVESNPHYKWYQGKYQEPMPKK